MKHTSLCSILLITSLSACTSLTSVESTKISYPRGLVYMLPSKVFEVQAQFEVTGCIPWSIDGVSLKSKVEASFTEHLVGDKAYFIDYEDLNTWTKVTDSTFQLSEKGFLLGINSSVSDQSANIINDSLGAVGKVVRANVFPQLPVAGNWMKFYNDADDTEITTEALRNEILSVDLPSIRDNIGSEKDVLNQRDIQKLISGKTASLCTGIETTLDQIDTLKSQLSAAKKQDGEKQKTIERLLGIDVQIKALGKLVTYYEKIGSESDHKAVASRLTNAMLEKENAEAQLNAFPPSQVDKLAARLAEKQSGLRFASKRYIDAKTATSMLVELDVNQLPTRFPDIVDVRNIEAASVLFTVSPIAHGIELLDEEPEDKHKEGIAYRVPVPSKVTLSIHSGDEAQQLKRDLKAGVFSPDSDTILEEAITMVPQFGPTAYLTLNNQMFDDNNINVTFSALTGAPLKLEYESVSKGEALAKSANDAAGQYLQLQIDRRNDEINAIEKAQALDKAELANRSTAVQSEQDQLMLTKAYAETELELLRAQQRLDAVRTGTATQADIELENLKTQQEILKQKLEIEKLKAEILKVQQVD